MTCNKTIVCIGGPRVCPLQSLFIVVDSQYAFLLIGKSCCLFVSSSVELSCLLRCDNTVQWCPIWTFAMGWNPFTIVFHIVLNMCFEVKPALKPVPWYYQLTLIKHFERDLHIFVVNEHQRMVRICGWDNRSNDSSGQCLA